MDYKQFVEAAIKENKEVLDRIDPEQVDKLIAEIMQAKSIHLYGMGRMQLSVRAFAMRLKHMGFDAWVVYDTTSPSIGPGDLLINHCGITNVELNVVTLAREAGARIAILTAHPENEHGKLADLTVRVPGQIFGTGDEVKSIQPLASLMEQALFIFVDIVTAMLMERMDVDPEDMRIRHTNLEGIPHKFA